MLSCWCNFLARHLCAHLPLVGFWSLFPLRYFSYCLALPLDVLGVRSSVPLRAGPVGSLLVAFFLLAHIAYAVLFGCVPVSWLGRLGPLSAAGRSQSLPSFLLGCVLFVAPCFARFSVRLSQCSPLVLFACCTFALIVVTSLLDVFLELFTASPERPHTSASPYGTNTAYS